MSREYKSLQAFWPVYMQEHNHPVNRQLHALGTGLALGCVTLAVLKRKPRLLALAPLLGYGLAWLGHFAVEKNRPATFKYPRFSLLCDFKMFGLMASGQMKRELKRLKTAESNIPESEHV